ncbi:MAG: TolC family protein [Firmicutes bacterium]|jgi:outer membrane protein|nr:TolC family protein [Bacillota bacterium]
MKRISFPVLVMSILWIMGGLVFAGSSQELLDLAQSIELAKEQSIQLQLSRLDLEEARLQFEQAKAMSLVQPSPSKLYQAEANLGITEKNLILAEQNLALEVEQDYYNYLRTQNLITVLEEALELAKRQLEVTESRRRVGAATEADVIRAQASVARTEADLAQVRDSHELSRRKFLQSLGLPVDTSIQLDEGIVAERVSIDLDRAIAEALANRVEVAQLDMMIGVAEKEVELATNDYTPGQQLAMAKIALEKARLRRQQLEDNLPLEIRHLYAQLQDAERRLDVTRIGVLEAEETMRTTTALYDVDMATHLDLMGAQANLTKARTDAIHAIFDYNLAKANLYKAMAWGLAEREVGNEKEHQD